MGRLLVVRHAQSVWNAAGRWQGWSDAPLSPTGEEQARQAARALLRMGAQPGLVRSSDLARARRTAELIAAELGHGQPVGVDADLREQDLGQWNGLTREEIDAKWPGQVEERRSGRLPQVPGGEAQDDFYERALRGLKRAAATGVKEALIVTHGGVLVVLERSLGAWDEANHHGNLMGWWVESQGLPPDLSLRALRPVDLLAGAPETVIGPA